MLSPNKKKKAIKKINNEPLFLYQHQLRRYDYSIFHFLRGFPNFIVIVIVIFYSISLHTFTI